MTDGGSLITFRSIGGKGITLPLVQSDQHIESEMFLRKCAPRCGLQVLLEFRRTNWIWQGEVRFQRQGFHFAVWSTRPEL